MVLAVAQIVTDGKYFCRDEATRADWYENVLFFSCLSGCRAQLRAERWLYILVPAAAAALLAALLLVCCCCRGCPLAWYLYLFMSSCNISVH